MEDFIGGVPLGDGGVFAGFEAHKKVVGGVPVFRDIETECLVVELLSYGDAEFSGGENFDEAGRIGFTRSQGPAIRECPAGIDADLPGVFEWMCRKAHAEKVA